MTFKQILVVAVVVIVVIAVLAGVYVYELIKHFL